ncbi:MULTISPECIES: hypothetical protein [Exiguobacterium]|uniref:hypothetical protein n=1 Tax=Exiguobacterium TaxID=33986 RepID=UPI0004947B12|nr:MULTISPECIES: hypothetical protein [Exiguobacterium]HCD58759.1 hypothetical protein [Exiguobacterium sp.]
MFKNMIYFDSKKVAEYKALLIGEKSLNVKNMKITSTKSVNGKIPIVSGGMTGTNEMEGEPINSLVLDCNEFEELLQEKDGEYFFDLVEKDYDIETITKSSIISFGGSLSIPNEFDMMELITQFKPIIMNSLNLESTQEEEVIKKIFEKENTKIPIFITDSTLNDWIGFTKLTSTDLIIGMDGLEDYEEEEVTFIAKIISKKYYKDEPIVVFDIMKDLLSISRGLRRQLGKDEIEGVENIKSANNTLILEILAIYS